MNTASFHSAGRLDIEFFIGRFRLQRFVFSAASVDFDVTAFTWQLLVKTNPGDRVNVISLTLNNGLSFPVYEDNVIEARFEAATTSIQEGDYYWQLVRTDTNEPWLNGKAKFSFGPLGSQGTAQEATINLVDQEISVELSSIVNVSTSFADLTGSPSDNAALAAALALKANLAGSKVIQLACSDETTALTAGTGKITFRMPYAMTVSAVRASLTTAQTSGSIFTVDINDGGTTILSTKITIDNTEKTSTTAATAPVISDTALADDAEITIDIDQIGDGTAKGLKVTLIGS